MNPLSCFFTIIIFFSRQNAPLTSFTVNRSVRHIDPLLIIHAVIEFVLFPSRA